MHLVQEGEVVWPAWFGSRLNPDIHKSNENPPPRPSVLWGRLPAGIAHFRRQNGPKPPEFGHRLDPLINHLWR